MSFSRRRSFSLAGVHALILGFAACRSGEGQNRLSEPSSSAHSARRGGVFLSTVKLGNGEAGPRGERFRLDEAWLEEVVERFESIPLRRRVSGTRLCVRLVEMAKPPLPSAAMDAEIHVEGPVEEVVSRDATVFFRDVVIISFKVGAGHDFPKAGTISIDDTRTAENVVTFTFSISDKSRKRTGIILDKSPKEPPKDRHNP